MKKIIVLLIMITCFFTLFSCNTNFVKESESNQVTITFIQDGEDNISETIRKGENLLTIPNLVAKVGYSVTWDRSDFTNITTDIIVRAIYTPHEYLITYELNNDNATISSNIQMVKYNESYILLIPSCEGFEFQGWKIKNANIFLESGKWTYLNNITLVAQWEKLGGWTKNF